MTPAMLPLPPCFDGARAADYHYRPDATQLAQAAADWRARHKLRPAAADETRVHLLGPRDREAIPQGSCSNRDVLFLQR